MADVLKGETIIYFGPEPWSGMWRNRHQLMSRLAGANDVWYVEPPARVRQRADRSGRGSRGIQTRLISRDESGVRIFHGPWWLPLTGREPFKRASIRLYLAVLSRAAGLRSRRPVVWLSRPNMTDYLGGLPAKLTIYHVVDEYSGYGDLSPARRRRVADREAELLSRVDVVIVVTPSLLDAKRGHNPNTYLVPNAVDFHAYADSTAPIPADIVGIPRPIIGYSGLVAARLDFELLLAAARARPDWSFVFVGHVREQGAHSWIQRLKVLPNVYFLGCKPVDETPYYVRRFDVSMIPYRTNLRARHAGPLKLYEYAAASTPIVATDFTAAREFEGCIEIVHDAQELLAACARYLDAGTASAAAAKNLRIAARNTWDQRVAQIACIVRRHAIHSP